MDRSLLDRIDSPEDLKSLDRAELKELCAQIRDYIVEVCSTNPGHLASSLGAVEMIVALHYVYSAPKDKIIFDVGHQAYAHKILTSRREAFRSLRDKDGISGFPNMAESPYDAFGVGHSSTSISAALGYAEAAKRLGDGSRSVAVIGDGAMTGGLAFEGLNNAGASRSDLLVILNDNNQSIDNNTGALHNHLLKLTTSSSYNRFKTKIWDLLGQGSFRVFLQRWIRSLKSWFVKKSGGDLFESLGFRYFGPVDGNNLDEMINTLSRIRDMKGPRVLHCMSVKGKGYAPAEQDPVTWHAPGKFDPSSGQRLSKPTEASLYQDVFGEVLLELCQKDSKVVGVTPAMAKGCGMTLLSRTLKDQFFDVGIEEEHAVTFSAGLCAAGFKPFCNIYSSFSQRSYDQIIHDVALQKLGVVLCFDRAGLVGEDGATHNGCFDMAAYRSIPDIVISSPKDEMELKNLMYTAYLHGTSPFIIRYPRGEGNGVDWKDKEAEKLEIGKAECLVEGSEVAIVSIGSAVSDALKAAESFAGRVGVYNFRFLKPFDTQTLAQIGQRYHTIITVEEGCLKGGLYSEVCESAQRLALSVKVEGLGIPDRFISHKSRAEQKAECGIDVAGIKKSLQKYLQINN